jgi:hypothetical protein
MNVNLELRPPLKFQYSTHHYFIAYVYVETNYDPRGIRTSKSRERGNIMKRHQTYLETAFVTENLHSTSLLNKVLFQWTNMSSNIMYYITWKIEPNKTANVYSWVASLKRTTCLTQIKKHTALMQSTGSISKWHNYILQSLFADVAMETEARSILFCVLYLVYGRIYFKTVNCLPSFN